MTVPTIKTAAAIGMLMAAVSCTQLGNEPAAMVTVEGPAMLAVVPEEQATGNSRADSADAVAAADKAPATQPAAAVGLPAGHPPIPSAQKNGELPAGHPPIPGSRGRELPAGHPPVPGTAGKTGELPAGHPEISQKQAADSGQPIMGTVKIHAMQGTADGPAIGADVPVSIEVYENGKLAGKLEAKTGAEGTLTISDVPLGKAFVTKAKLVYQGVAYEGATKAHDGVATSEEVHVKVYETTEERPDWSIQMRHVILQPANGKVAVTEVLSVENPGDRAWVGVPGTDGKRVAFSLVLPKGAADLHLIEGLDNCCSKVVDGMIGETKPMAPGVHQYRLTYTLPVVNGAAEYLVASAAPVQSMMVMAPAEGVEVVASGLEGPRVVDMGGRKSSYFKGSSLPAGQTVSVKLTGVSASAAADASGRTVMAGTLGSSQIGKIVGAVGALVVALCGLSFLVIKPKARKA